MLKSLLKTLIVSLLGTAAVALLNMPTDVHLPAILFTLCGIFFSVGMSQIMTYDISKIINEKYFQSMKTTLNTITKSFVMQFICCTIAFIGYEILNEQKKAAFSIIIKDFDFSLIRFFNVILIYCLLYFVFNFYKLLKNKIELDSKIRQESLDI
jgi:hypothetical protein